MNILPSIYRESIHFFEQSFVPTLTARQKQISALALIALSCLVACYALYTCYRTWKVSISENKKIQDPQNIPYIREEAKADYKQGIKIFSTEVLQRVITESPNENKLISPLGISFLLSMVLHGVSRGMQRGINPIVRLPLNNDKMKVCAFELIKKLQKMGFDLAGLVYLNPQFRLNPEYQKLVSEYYQSMVQEGSSADEVNQWVNKTTHGQIPDIISQDDLTDFVVVLANALHFKAKWACPFKAEDTYSEEFTTAEAEKVQTEMMHQTNLVEYFENDDCQAIKMNYEDAKGVSLMLILPKKDNDFSFVDETTFDEISQGVTSQRVAMAVPKFKLEEEVDVKAMLKDMGITAIFDEEKGVDVSSLIDYTHRAPDKAHISKMKQKSALTCDEEGTEASTVTVAIIETESCCMPPENDKKIKFNRPFLAALVSEDAPILFGVIRNPSAK